MARKDGAERVARNVRGGHAATWQAGGWAYELERAPFERHHKDRHAAVFALKVWDGARLIFRDRIQVWDGIPGDVRTDLAHTVRVVTKNGLRPWVRANPGTVSTFYADADDGYVQRSDADYADAMSGTPTFETSPDTSAELDVGQASDSGYLLAQAFLAFDLSGLDDDQVISSAVLSVWLGFDQTTDDFVAEAREYNWATPLTTAAWRTGAQLSALTRLGTLDTSSFAGGYEDFVEDGTNFADAVDPTGTLRIVICSANHVTETAPSDYEYFSFKSANTSGTTQDPKLVVTHADPAAPFTITAEAEVTFTQAGFDLTAPMRVTSTATASLTGTASVATGQVTGSYTLEVDWDNDGDFSEDIEDITEYVMDCQTFTGRDYASHLTGNAAPGTLVAYLNNADGRFSSFKTGSPLYESDGWLGRKVRLRSATSTPTDPVILARDRFNRANGSLGTAEIGGSWTNLVAGLAIVDQVVYSSGATDIGTVDCGEADHYVQVRIAEPGSGTGAGVDIYFRVADGSNYGVFGLRSNGQGGGSVVVSGSTVSEFSVEIPWVVGTILAVYAVGNVATCYVNGVPVGTLDIADDTATDVGFAVTKSGGDDSAGADDFLVLSGLPTPTDGVLWTGTLEYVEPTSVPGPFKTATLRAVGPLRKLNETDVTPPVYLEGVQTGHAIGAILNRAGITLPGRIDPGQLTTGPYVRDEDSALALCRELEDVEIGFLHETHEGQVAFDSRAVRELSQTVDAVFSDSTADPFALRYQSIRQLDWRDLIFNKVKASLSPYSEGSPTTLYTDPGPYALASGESRELTATYSGLVSRWTGHSRDVRIGGAPTVISVASETFAEGTTTAAVDMPATVAADDLLLVVSTHPMSAAGWTELPGYVYAKNAVGDEDGTSVNFTVASSPNPIVVHVFRIDDWPGSLSNISGLWVYDSGYWVNPQVFGGGTYYNEIRANFPWGAIPTLVIASVRGLGITPNPNVSAAPSGYSGLTYAELQASGGDYSYLATAYKTVTATTEKPGAFTVTGDDPRFGQVYALRGNPSSETPVTGNLPNGADGKFTIGYNASVGGTTQVHENIEVTGYPIVEGDLVTVVSEDTTSQDTYGVKEYPEVAPLFPNTGEAQLWADTILAASKDPHPLLEIGFTANKSAAYMTQALNRRVGDRITVTAENNADLGIDEDFFIESIEHHLSQGNTRHDVTWTLSPASVTDP